MSKKPLTSPVEIIWKDRKRVIFFGLPLSFTKYGLSKEILYVKRGFLSSREDEVRLYRILDISLRRSLIQKIFGLGSIEITSSDKTLGNFVIKNIKRSKDVKKLLSEYVETERTNKRVVNRENMHDEDCVHGGDDFEDDII